MDENEIKNEALINQEENQKSENEIKDNIDEEKVNEKIENKEKDEIKDNINEEKNDKIDINENNEKVENKENIKEEKKEDKENNENVDDKKDNENKENSDENEKKENNDKNEDKNEEKENKDKEDIIETQNQKQEGEQEHLIIKENLINDNNDERILPNDENTNININNQNVITGQREVFDYLITIKYSKFLCIPYFIFRNIFYFYFPFKKLPSNQIKLSEMPTPPFAVIRSECK